MYCHKSLWKFIWISYPNVHAVFIRDICVINDNKRGLTKLVEYLLHTKECQSTQFIGLAKINLYSVTQLSAKSNQTDVWYLWNDTTKSHSEFFLVQFVY